MEAAEQQQPQPEPETEQKQPPQHVAERKPPIPDHPPYAEMVRVALCALAEPGGSSERSISDFIVASFSGLPPAHDKFLPYYLGKLVSSRHLSVPSPGRYLLAPELIHGSLPHHYRRRRRASSGPRSDSPPNKRPGKHRRPAAEKEESPPVSAPVPAAMQQQRGRDDYHEPLQPQEELASQASASTTPMAPALKE